MDFNSTSDYHDMPEFWKEYLNNVMYMNQIARYLNYGLGSAGVTLNTLTFIAILRNTCPLKLQLKLLASLGASDIVIAGVSSIHFDVCPDVVWIKLDYCLETDPSRLTPSFCVAGRIVGDIYTVAQYSGLFAMFAITINLLCAVVRPISHYQQQPTKMDNVIVISGWVVPAVAIVTLRFLKKYDHCEERDFFNLFSPDHAGEIYLIVAVFSFVPFAVLYIAISCKIRQHARRAPSSQTRSISKAVWTMVLIIVTYLVCMWTLVWMVIHSLLMEGPSPYFSLFQSMYSCNTVFDAIIYALRVPEIRSNLSAMFGRCCVRSLRACTDTTTAPSSG